MPTIPDTREKALRALVRAEKQGREVAVTARKCQTAAMALLDRANEQIKKLAPLVDDPDPERRRAARIAYLRAVQTRARAVQADALAAEQIARHRSDPQRQ